MKNLKDKIKYDVCYNTSFGFSNPENDIEEDMFSYTDVKEAVLEFKKTLNKFKEDIPMTIEFDFDEVFGNFTNN